MKNTKIASILIIVSLSILVFCACGTMQSTNKKKSPMKSPTTMESPATTLPKPNQTQAMKTFYAGILKTLVNAKTITQVQSEKVLVVLTKSITQNAGTNTQSPTSTNNGNGTTSGTVTTNPTETTDGTINGTSLSNNGLTGLVTSGVITQKQADIINQKIEAGMKK